MDNNDDQIAEAMRRSAAAAGDDQREIARLRADLARVTGEHEQLRTRYLELCEDNAEQARTIERLREALTDLVSVADALPKEWAINTTTHRAALAETSE